MSITGDNDRVIVAAARDVSRHHLVVIAAVIDSCKTHRLVVII